MDTPTPAQGDAFVAPVDRMVAADRAAGGGSVAVTLPEAMTAHPRTPGTFRDAIGWPSNEVAFDLRSERVAADMSVRELAHYLGFGTSYLYQIESGRCGVSRQMRDHIRAALTIQNRIPLVPIGAELGDGGNTDRADLADVIPVTMAARRFGVSEPTFRRRVRAYAVPLFTDPRDNRKKLIRVSDVDRLAALGGRLGEGDGGD